MTRRKKTTTTLARRSSTALVPDHRRDQDYAAELALGARSSATQRAYVSDLRAWMAYADAAGLGHFPVEPEGLAAWIGHMAQRGLKISTIRRRCSAVSEWHKAKRHPSPAGAPVVREVLKGCARKLRSAPTKKRALTAELVTKIVDLIPKGADGHRDRALMLVGLTTGMRRSELVALQWDHVTEEDEDDAVLLFLPHSKTDQEGRGRYVALKRAKRASVCPVRALEAWRKVSDQEHVFPMSDRTVARLVKRYVAAIGENPDAFGAHSFRMGFMTEAKRGGADLSDIMVQSGHKSEKVAAGYIEALKHAANPAVDAVLSRLAK